MSPVRVPCRPQARNAPSMAAAVIMTGTIIGAMIRLAISPAPGIRPRTSPTAAAVPATVATVALGNMMVALVAMASSQTEELESFRYHCKDRPGGGKVRNGAELNDTIATMTIGEMRNTMIPRQNAARSDDHRCSEWAPVIGHRSVSG